MATSARVQHRLLSLLLVGCLALHKSDATPTYTVIAPNVVRPNTDYLVAVTAHDIRENQDVELRIKGISDTGQTIEIRQDTTVQSDETQIVRMRIGELSSGRYTLTARGSSPLVFDQSQDLTYIHKGYSVFIQTDQAIYRPGNTVKFRAIVVNPQLKPSVVGSIDVSMRDGGGNLIRHWKRVFTTKGVFAGELELAESPVLGDWNITVDVRGQVFSKSFLVAQYVLPKFRVDIDLPDYGTFTDGNTKATIKAHYHHGGAVKGEATIAVFPKYKSSYLQPVFLEPVRRVIDIDGQVSVDINLAKELNLSDDFAREVVFDVQVKEDLTERIQNNTAYMVLYKHHYKIEMLPTADAFKPGMPYTAYLKVAKQDDTPVHDELNQLSIRWGFGTDPDKYNTTEFIVPEDGIIKIKIIPPVSGREDVLGIEATYKSLTQWFSTVPRAVSKSNNYIQARLLTPVPEVDKRVRISITSTEGVSSVTYQIFGRGKLGFAETIKASGASYNELNFRALPEMSPRCRVVVYYVRPGGEIVADSLEFKVKGALTNSVELWTSRKSAVSGEEVTLNVKTKPNSFVGIMAVDKSVRALKTGHDIIENDVIEELRSYDSGKVPSFFPWLQIIEGKEGSLYWYTGNSASEQAFQDSGAIILTNGQLQMPSKTTPSILIGNEAQSRPVGRPLPHPDVDTLNPDKGPGVTYEASNRPYLEGPYAFSRLPEPVDNNPKIYLTNDLPSTWLFINTTTDTEGLAALPVHAPALANTSWILSGFCLDSLNGLGITKEMPQFDVFQPFFVMVDLPYSVKRGETVAVQLVIYNYLDKDISAEVTLENFDGEGFVFGSRHSNEIRDNELASGDPFRTKRIGVKPGRGTLASFIITPTEVGTVKMKITAKSGTVGQDVQIKELHVEAEGEPMHNNTAVFLDMRSTSDKEINMTLAIPRTAVPGSEKIAVSAIADPVGPAMNHLKRLIRYPTGCGEQNMLQMTPAVILAEYLESTGQFKGPLEKMARHLITNTYQRQLTYKLSDGSFSAFGESDQRGSVWVTALTARYFRLANSFIDVDENVINKALNWLVSNQAANGSFAETGRITYERLQDDSMAMTAFTSLCFLDNTFDLDTALRNAMNRGISYLAENWDTVEDPYVISIVAYVLARVDHPVKNQAFTLLESYAHRDGEDKKWWQTELEDFETGNPWLSMPNSANIEMTSYALLTMLLRNEFDKTIPVVNWLLSQQNENGGFASSTDTYVAILALKKFSAKLNIPLRGTDINVQYTYLKTVRRIPIKSETPTIMHVRILPSETRDLRLRATGTGVGLLQVSYQYNLNVTAAWPSFVVNPQVFKSSTANHMQVTVCASYIISNAGSSNMAVMEVNLPSGFTANIDALPALRRHRGVKRVDLEKGDTKVVLYFEQMTHSEVCPTISAFRTHRVANQKPALVLVYDYYDQSRVARSFYDIVPATLCDICIGDDCPDDGCPDRPTFPTFGNYAYGVPDNVDTDGGGAASHVACSSILTLVASIIFHWVLMK